MNNLKSGYKNPASIEETTVYSFLAPKIIEIFRERCSRIHKNDLANLFFQRVRFNKQIFDSVLSVLIEQNIIERDNRSSYLILSKEAVE